MAVQRILVVDDSAAIRETIGILLAGDFEVTAFSVDAYLAQSSPAAAAHELVIADELLRSTAVQLPPLARCLWLRDADTPSTGASADQQDDFLPRRFSPRELRQRVATLLAEPPRGRPGPSQRLRAQRPYLPNPAAQMIAQAAGNALPLHLVGEAGAGKRALARALHRECGGGSFVAVSATGFAPYVFPRGVTRPATLYIHDVDRLPDEGQQRLLGGLDLQGRFRGPAGFDMRLVSASTRELASLVEDGQFSSELYYRVTVLTARLPPLRERAADLPAIARQVAGELAESLDLPPVSFTAGALERLSRYLWFGNLAELEAVLARTLSLRRSGEIDADDLLFDSARLHARSAAADGKPATIPSEHLRPPGRTAQGAAARRRSAAGNTRADSVHRGLDLIINELADEFKNPLVTIKTFAQHCRRALRNGADEKEFARLTGEAVERMDHVLENLLGFTRLGNPAPRAVALDGLLTQLMDEQRTSLGARELGLDYEAPPAVITAVDSGQVNYAIGNLIRSLARSLAPGDSLTVHYAPPASILFQLPVGAPPLGGHLSLLLDESGERAPALPLGLAIATAVLERNGVQVSLEDETEPKTVTVGFPLAGQEEGEEGVVISDGVSPRTGS